MMMVIVLLMTIMIKSCCHAPDVDVIDDGNNEDMMMVLVLLMIIMTKLCDHSHVIGDIDDE